MPNSNILYGDKRNIVVIHDDKQVDPYPQFKIRNLEEFDVSIRLDEEKTWGSKFALTNGYKTQESEIWTLENENFRDESYTTSELFEWLIYIKKAPKDGKLYFSVMNKDVEWLYQGELTQEEIDNGAVRPDEIVGSFALYSPKSNHIVGGKNYMAGKVGHVPAPYFIDLGGNKIKGKMYLDKNYLIIEIPESLFNWDYSKEPLLLDPTFGYTSVGASSYSLNQGYLVSSKYNLGEAGTVESIHVHGNCVSSSLIIGGLYSDNSGTPNALLTTNTNEANISTTVMWYTNTLSSSYSASSADYWIAVINKNSSTSSFNFTGDSSGGTSRTQYGGSYTVPPSTYPSTVSSSRKYSIYATYTAGGSTSKLKKYFSAAAAKFKKIDNTAIANVKKLLGASN